MQWFIKHLRFALCALAFSLAGTASATHMFFGEWCYTNGVLGAQAGDQSNFLLSSTAGSLSGATFSEGTTLSSGLVVVSPWNQVLTAVPGTGLDFDQWVLVNRNEYATTLIYLSTATLLKTYAANPLAIAYSTDLNTICSKYQAISIVPCFFWLKYPLYYNANRNGYGSWRDQNGPVNNKYIYTNEVTVAAIETLTWGSRPGYEALGWSTSSNATEAAYAPGETVANAGAAFGATTNGVTLYLVWQKKDYPVTLDAQGGTVSPSTITNRIDEAMTLPTPTWEGYDFKGWYTSESGGTCVTNGQLVTSTLLDYATFYAQWQQHCQVTYSFKTETGGSTNVIADVSYGGTPVPPNPTEPVGYHFVRWNPEVESITYSRTIEAVYEGNGYVVSFDANGGTGTMSTQSFTYGTAKNLAANLFTREGYTMAGWSTASNSTVVTYANNASVSDLTAADGETVTLYAVWTANTYTIVYDKGDEDATGSVESQTATWNGTPTVLRKNRFENDGCTFRCWKGQDDVEYKAQSTVSNLTEKANGTFTMTAVWSWNYTMAFDANGGSGTMTNVVMDGGSAQTIPANEFTRTRYAFAGWALNPDSSVAYADQAHVKADELDVLKGETVTLYAIWSPNAYTVTFDANGGTGTMDDLNIGVDEARTVTNTFTRTGYTFAGWAKSAEGAVEFAPDAEVTGLSSVKDVTVCLYAVWEPIAYRIVFDPGLEEDLVAGEMAPMDVTYDSVTNLTPCAFTATEGSFVEWTATNGTAYADGATVSNLTATADDEVTLTARWNATVYYVTFEANGGEGTMARLSLKPGQSQALPTNAFTRADYLFAGWATTSEGAVAYADGATVADLGETGTTVPLYAVWTRDQRTEFSKAADTDIPLTAAGSGLDNWTVVSNVSCKGVSSVQMSSDGDTSSSLVGTVTGPGTLTFQWKCDQAEGTFNWEKIVGPRFQWSTNETDSSDYETVLPNTAWSTVTVDITSTNTTYLFWRAYNYKVNYNPVAYTLWLDDVTWTPRAASPEPTVENVPTISALASNASGLALSFTADARFDYQLLGTNELTAADWPVLRNIEITNETMTVDGLLDEDAPQMFYKVRVIQKK